MKGGDMGAGMAAGAGMAGMAGAGAGAGGKGIVPDQDIAPLLAELDGVTGADAGTGAGTEAGDMAGEGEPDVSGMAKTMRVSVEKAQALFDAAQMHDDLAEMTPDDLGAYLLSNTARLIDLEESIAAESDMEAEMGSDDDYEDYSA